MDRDFNEIQRAQRMLPGTLVFGDTLADHWPENISNRVKNQSSARRTFAKYVSNAMQCVIALSALLLAILMLHVCGN